MNWLRGTFAKSGTNIAAKIIVINKKEKSSRN
jgi:hypothetical protein